MSSLLKVCFWTLMAITSAKQTKSKNKIESKSVHKHESDTIIVQSSCNDLDDGLYYLKPSADGLVIPAICSNGYTMLDLSLHIDSISSYLSSMDYSRVSSQIIGSSLDDFVNFRDWFTPSTEDTLFLVSPDCSQCDDTDDSTSNTAYYMSSYYFCPNSMQTNMCGASGSEQDDGSWDQFCYECQDDVNDKTLWSQCSALAVDADTQIVTDHDACVTQTLILRPSMTTTRNYCTCYKPNDDSITQYEVSTDDLPLVTVDLEQIDIDSIGPSVVYQTSDNANDDDDSANELTPENNVVYLSNDDFAYGTYKISEPGTYILTEDIVLNFNTPHDNELNTPDSWSPNNYDMDNLGWFPTMSQASDDGTYPGLYSYHGIYSLGFFAGMTVESNNVVIDLNGHQMEMDYAFYVQQRYFSLIELSDRVFVPGEGPSNYGSDQEFYASNVVIKDGRLGLTSHHAIHANNADQITISDVSMQHFDLAGVGCNACTNVYISDCNIGPSNTNIPVLGRYAHARALLPRLRELADNYGTEDIQFFDRSQTTVNDLIDRLVSQMDMVFFNTVHGVAYDDDDSEWMAAKELFLNPTGYMDGGSVYGMVFNGQGSAMRSIGSNTDGTSDITIHNVEIQGIYANPIEKFKTMDNGGMRLMFQDPIDWEAVTDQIDDPLTTVYVGDSYTDLAFAVDMFVDSWYYLNSMRMTDAVRELVFQGSNVGFAGNFKLVGGGDVQLTSSKGAIGIRIEGVDNFAVTGCIIHDIENHGAMGSALAGEYETSGLYNELPDVQYGYTGNRAQGLMTFGATGTIDGLDVYGVISHTGSSHGIVTYQGSDVTATNIAVWNVQAGTMLEQDDVDSLALPNSKPMACSFEARGINTNIAIKTHASTSVGIAGTFIVGYDQCDSEANVASGGNIVGVCDHCYNKDLSMDASASYISLPSDCSGLEDGVQYILPDDAVGTIIPVRCSDGWTMLDGSLSPNIRDYFTSYAMSHRDLSLMLPNTDEHISWREWFVPANENTLFRTSVNCDVCATDLDNGLGDNVVYHATGDYLCFYIRKQDNTCENGEIYCRTCDEEKAKTYDQAYDPSDPESETYPMWEQCKYIRTSADEASTDDHYSCTHRAPFSWPVLSHDGTGCICYKGGDDDDTTRQYTISMDEATGQFETNNNDALHDVEANSEYLNVELRNSDFLEGTYRITQPGVYKVMEDLYFNFNAPPEELTSDDTWSPNDFQENGDVWWWPRKDQAEEYPGADSYMDPFTIGYFAGISVETNDVILDLNGHSIEMAYPFYVQQRFFSLIELANRPFAPGKGAANWGTEIHYASNVVVKNGILGLTSHHCLHGNFLYNVLVDNVQMSNFDVAGFGCGQCQKVELRDVDVGPQHTQIPVLGRYTHARAFMPRLQEFMDEFGDTVIPFWNRSPTVNELGARLINQMDMVYNNVVNGVEYDDTDTEWLEAKRVFINQWGLQDASASYGIVFAGGAAVSAIGTRIENEGNITMTNVNVHDLKSHVREKFKVYGAGTTVTMRGLFRDTIDWEDIVEGFDDLDNAKYIGNAYEDIIFAFALTPDLVPHWSFLYTLQIEEFVRDWVMTGDASELEQSLDIHCGTDIQVHSVKGAIGVRIDGADTLLIDGLTISNVASTAETGSMRCGEYSTPQIAGEQVFIQPGWNGNKAYGMTLVYTSGQLNDVTIDGVSSNTGSAYGLRVFDGCDVTVVGDVSVSNVMAGTDYAEQQIDMQFMDGSLVNPLPQACGVHLYTTEDNLVFGDGSNVQSTNVIGYRTCDDVLTIMGDTFTASLAGECDNCVVEDMIVVSDDVKGKKSSLKSYVALFGNNHYLLSLLAAFICIVVYAFYKYSNRFKYDKLLSSSSNGGKSFWNYYASLKENEKTPLLN